MTAGRHHHRLHPGGGRYARALRVNELLRQVLAEELERLADADERLRLLTITGVDTAADLRHATVYVSRLSADAAEVLEERRPRLQQLVGRQVRMKRTPRLRFAEDPAIISGERVEEVLRRIGHGDQDRPPEGGSTSP